MVNLGESRERWRAKECSYSYVTFMVCHVDPLVLSPLWNLAVEEMSAEKEGHVVKRALNSEPRNQDWSIVPII